jgi:hypothetical protein
VAAAQASGNTLIDNHAIVREAFVQEAEIEDARQWWIFAPQVPPDIKRMPEAVDHDLRS